MTTVKPVICPACGRSMERKPTTLDDQTQTQCARCHDRWMRSAPPVWPASSITALIVTVVGLAAIAFIGVFMVRSSGPTRVALARQVAPMVVPAPVVPVVTPTDALITSAEHYYSFNERSLVINGGIRLVQNEIGQRASGLMHDCDTGTDPVAGTVVRFPRQSSYVEIPGTEGEHPTQFTLSAWVNITGDTNGSVIDKADWRDNGTRGFGLRIVRARANAFVGQGTWVEMDSLQELPTKKWVHIATTYDGENLKLYVNGELDRTRPVPGPFNPSDYPIRIGNAVYEEGHDRMLPGALHDVGIFYRALTADDIKLLMNRKS